MDIEILRRKLQEINNDGYVVSKRKGNTGIGYTLESLLGIDENNIQVPDLGSIELKSKRITAHTPVTMFTFNKGVWQIKQKEVIETYGYTDTTGRKALYCTVDTKPNQQGLYSTITNTSLTMRHTNGTHIAEWQADHIGETLRRKMPALVLVQAETRVNSEEKEEFHFNKAYLLSKPDVVQLLAMIKTNDVIIDVRMHINKRGSVRNHGTAFRMNESKLHHCFTYKEELI